MNIKAFVMIKRTLYFGSAAYLKVRQNQLLVSFPADSGKPTRQVPLEDVGLLVLDHQQITISQATLAAFIAQNAAVLCCDSRHMPAGLILPFGTNYTFTEKLRHQLAASAPLRKNLWQQTIKAKIQNQAAVLSSYGIDVQNMVRWAGKVKSGDPDNFEGRAAANYWQKLLALQQGATVRHRLAEPPNNLLNYGYAVLRAIVARSLVASGMLPAVGIHHSNKYNAFCLADDVMEPYRPIVDKLVMGLLKHFDADAIAQLTPKVKQALLVIPTLDVVIDNERSPLMVGMQRTTASLMQCFEGTKRKILYPVV